MSAGSPASTELRNPLDAQQDEPIVALPYGEPDAIAHLRCEGIEQHRLGGNSHQLHGAHREPRDGLVAHDDQVRRGPRNDNAAHLIGGRTENRAPDADSEGGEEHGEQETDERA